MYRILCKVAVWVATKVEMAWDKSMDAVMGYRIGRIALWFVAINVSLTLPAVFIGRAWLVAWNAPTVSTAQQTRIPESPLDKQRVQVHAEELIMRPLEIKYKKLDEARFQTQSEWIAATTDVSRFVLILRIRTLSEEMRDILTDLQACAERLRGVDVNTELWREYTDKLTAQYDNDLARLDGELTQVINIQCEMQAMWFAANK